MGMVVEGICFSRFLVYLRLSLFGTTSYRSASLYSAAIPPVVMRVPYALYVRWVSCS